MKFDFTLLEAKKVKNKNLNRYRDVSPYDHTRIVLSKGSCDYINASLVKVRYPNPPLLRYFNTFLVEVLASFMFISYIGCNPKLT